MDPVEFTGSGRSEAARARKWLWIGIAVAVAIAVLRSGLSGPLLLVCGIVVGCFLVIDRKLLHRMRSGARVALVDADGIESPLFGGTPKRFAWHQIAGASVRAVHNDRRLQLQLRPVAGREDRRAFWTGRNPLRPDFSVSALTPGQQEELLRLVLQRVGVQDVQASLDASDLRQERVFKERLEALAPVPWLTHALVALNVLVFLWMAAVGANGLRAEAPVLLDWGANSAHEVVVRGEWWRLLTAAFLHGGLFHLAMNMIGLLSAGPTVERLYGRAQFALIYLGAALVGSALSLHFSAQRVVSVGASGAVFGVAIAMLVGLHGHRRELPRGFVRQTTGGLGFFIVYSLLQGFAREGIDNAAHVGGLLAGAVLAWLLPTRLDAQRFAARMRPRATAGGIAAVVVVAVLVGSAGPGVDQRQLFSSLQSLQRGMRALEGAYRGLERDQAQVKSGVMTELQLDERSRRVHAPAFRGVVEQLQEVKLPADDPRQAFAADALRAAQLIAEMLAMESDIVDGKPVPARPERHAAAERELARVSARMKEQAERLRKGPPR